MDSSARVNERHSVQAPSRIQLAKPSDKRHGSNVNCNGLNCSEEEITGTRNHHRSPGPSPPHAPTPRSDIHKHIGSVNPMEMFLANTDDRFTGWLTGGPSHLLAPIVGDVFGALLHLDIEISPITHSLCHHAVAGIIMSYSSTPGFAPNSAKYQLSQSSQSAQPEPHYEMDIRQDLFGIGAQFGC